MKIGVLTHNYPRFPGDFSGRFVAALCVELARQGHDVTVLAPWDPAYVAPRVGQARDMSHATQAGVPRPAGERVHLVLYRYALLPRWHRLGYMRTMRADLAMRSVTYLLAPGLFAAGSLAALRWARQARPDVLHAHWVLPSGFMAALAARRYRIPLAVSIPGSDATVAGQNPLFRRMARFAFDQAGLISANSTALRDVAVAELGADPQRCELIAYGVDPDALHPELAGTADLRAKLGIPPEAVVVLAVGRMVYKKGFDGLLRAAAQPALAGLPAPLHLVLVGEGDQWAEWQALGRQLGLAEHAHWVGNVPSDGIGVYYNTADMLAMPAVTRPADGLNVTVLDAMSCARPIIATDAAGNTLAVEDGVNGFVVPEGDPVALAQAIRRLVVDPGLRSRMGAAGRARIDAELGWPHLARRYVAYFERLRAA